VANPIILRRKIIFCPLYCSNWFWKRVAR